MSHYCVVVARTTHFQTVGLAVDGLGKQVIEWPDDHRPSFVAPRSSSAVSARATTLLIRLGLVAFRVGRVVPASVSASIAACPVAPPARVFPTGWVIIGGVTSPSGIAVSPVAFLAVIAVSPAAFLAVFFRPVTGVLCVGIPGVFRFGSACAGFTSSAQPVRVPILCPVKPQAVVCPAAVARTGVYGEENFCGPP